MRKVKFSLMKTLCILLGAVMVLLNLTACSTTKANGIDEGKVVVLNNQQKEIDDVPSIKKIIEVKGFAGYHWLEDNRILGVAIKDGTKNIAIYNVKDQTIDNITDNKNMPDRCYIYWHRIINCLSQYQPPKDYVIFREGVVDSILTEYAILVYDVKEGKIVRIDENIRDAQLMDNNQIYYAKGLKVYRYDMVSNEKSEIVFPEDLANKLQYYFPTLEDYMEYHQPNEEEYSEFNLKFSKERFDEETKNNCIDRIEIEGDKLAVSSYNHQRYVFDMKNQTYKKGWIEHKEYDNGLIKIGEVAVLKQNQMPRELWETDKNGKPIEFIDKTNDFVGGFYLSPDKSKLIYELIYPIGEERKYIYDFKSNKKVTLFGECYAGIYWNEASNKLVCSEAAYFYKELSSKIIILND